MIPENYIEKNLGYNDIDFFNINLAQDSETNSISFFYENLNIRLHFVTSKELHHVYPTILLQSHINDLLTNPMNKLLENYNLNTTNESSIYTLGNISKEYNTYNLYFYIKVDELYIIGKFTCQNSFSEEWKVIFEHIIFSTGRIDLSGTI